MEDLLKLLDGAGATRDGAVTATREDNDVDVQYLLLELPESPGKRLMSLQDLHTPAPTLHIDGATHPVEFAEDVGSTLIFDREALKRIAETEAAPSVGPVMPEQKKTLVCVTTKRLRTHAI